MGVRKEKGPTLVVVCGPPCTGKSAIAAALASRLNVPHLEMDAMRLRLIPASHHEQEHRDIAYRAMHHAAELLLPLQGTVVLDATYTRSLQRRELKNLADRLEAHVYLVQCMTSPEQAAARLLSRQPGAHAALDLTLPAVRTAVAQFAYADGGLVLHTDAQQINASVAQALSYITSGERFTNWSWISIAPVGALPGERNVSVDAVYHEWYNELRRYRDYEHGIVVWASTILVALGGGLVALITADKQPDLTISQGVLVSLLVLLFALIAAWITEYVARRYRELRNQADQLQPGWKQDLDARFVEDLPPLRNPQKAQLLLLGLLSSIAMGLVWLLV